MYWIHTNGRVLNEELLYANLRSYFFCIYSFSIQNPYMESFAWILMLEE